MKRKDPPKQQRNAPCQCGSGKKYKKCHLLIEREEAIQADLAFHRQMKERAEETERIAKAAMNDPSYVAKTRIGRPSALTTAVIMGAMLGGMGGFERNR